MTETFKFCILFEEGPGRDLAQLAPGWEMGEIPVGLLVRPFESAANWTKQRQIIASWNLPPIRASSHFLHSWGLKPVGPDVDWEQLEFWTKRTFARLAGLGVEVAGVYGDFFSVPDGFSRTTAMDQAIRFVDRMADYADQYNMFVALEPTANPSTLWPMYLDGIQFAKAEVGRPSVRVMADVNYFIKGSQPLEHIARDPHYCLHVHIAGDHGQPGVGDRVKVHRQLFSILRDIGYTRGVSAACPWVSTKDGPFDFRKETEKTLSYLKSLRELVYSGS